jgi:deuterolysin
MAAGETIELNFDIAELHDLSNGGTFDFVSQGAISYAEEGTVEIAGAFPFNSNTLSASIDGRQAAAVRKRFHEKRIALQPDCKGTKETLTKDAIKNCELLAKEAQKAAESGPAEKMEEYFKSSSKATRDTVADVFAKIAKECSTFDGGASRYYCSDEYQACSLGVLAYTHRPSSHMYNCQLYYDALPPLTEKCHVQDQASTTLHETTHLTSVKGTVDYGSYGYNTVRRLSAAQNLNHADTYTLFANGMSNKPNPVPEVYAAFEDTNKSTLTAIHVNC